VSSDKRNKLYPPPSPLTKYSDGKGGHITVLPSPIVKRDLRDHAYTKDLDEKTLTLATTLAERIAISIIRETLNQQLEGVIEKVSERLVENISSKLPSQQVIIQQTASESLPQIKKEVSDFEFKTDISIDRSEGMKIKGKASKKTETNDSTDATLDILDQLNL
jgi:phenylpyruvate tautomerase PptA (4-oxalocrotonate tautomerase family)